MNRPPRAKPHNKPSLIFTTSDFYGNILELTEQTWVQHVLNEHPEMSGYEDLVKNVIRDPHEVRVSAKTDLGLAFISSAGVGPRSEGIRVLANYADSFYQKGSTAGRVATAYPIDIVKYGNPQLGKTIYKKGGTK